MRNHNKDIVTTLRMAISELKKEEIDFVFITTPPNTHISLAQDCLKYNKHFFIEKPLSINVDAYIPGKITSIIENEGVVIIKASYGTEFEAEKVIDFFSTSGEKIYKNILNENKNKCCS